MNIPGLSALSQSYLNDTDTSKTNTKKETSEEKTNATDKNDQGVVYESSSNKKTGKTDTALVNQLKTDLENRKAQLQSMVEKMLSKQGEAYNKGMDIFQIIRSGNLKVDAETAAKAQADIAEDGYWGVEQTSDRMLSFAKALTGNDPSQADKMLDAFKKGFEQATRSWGDKLPDICQRTYDATLKKFDEWKNGSSANPDQTKTQA